MRGKEIEELFRALFALIGASPLAACIAVLILLVLLCGAIAKIFEFVAKLIELLKPVASSIFSKRTAGRNTKAFINRRKQFLRVLAADLSSIAKAEAWNDQHFTDLEAEVEIEGSYYSSAVRRLLRKRSSGLRREPSLIKAIDQSSEKCLLLTGDPGAGKSVALRHLALQMIDRSVNSRKDGALIPLYINLRELNLHPGSSITVDTIREFVIDNIRRGDADTADYMKQNWSDFQAKGVWFFLFDSFDEIPAVMHAAANETAVAVYGNAIRQFMDGLGTCRGVLASREYKSPASISWPKLRILPLTEEKQEDLIRHTFLEETHKVIALRSVSRSASATYKNPLFLTLLCRYIKANQFAPANEHELLYAHVESLAKRDSDYVVRTWGFTPRELLAGASEVARLFAVSTEVGLAPTIAEIESAARKDVNGLGWEQLSKLIEALTYVKIGRTDVASSDSSVRRFAFSHRRYQECLFASYLAKVPTAIPPVALIVDARWREYLVALLQIAPKKDIEAIVRVAAKFIDDRGTRINLRGRRYFGEEVHTYSWTDSELEHVISVFLEAKRYSPDGPWDMLIGPVEKILGRVWSKGDYYDRDKVMRYCGIGSESALEKRVEFCMRSGIPRLEEMAVDACRFLGQPSKTLAQWVRMHVSGRLITSYKRFDFLRWEAIAADLPVQYQMSVPIERARSLSRYSIASKAFIGINEALDMLMMRIIPAHTSMRGDGHRKVIASVKSIALQAVYPMLGIFILAVFLFKDGLNMSEKIVLAPLFIFTLLIVKYCIQISSWYLPEKLALRVLIPHWAKVLRAIKRDRIIFMVSFIFLVLPGVVIFWICRLLGWFSELGFDLMFIGSVGFYFFIFAVFGIYSFITSKRGEAVIAGVLKDASNLPQAMNLVSTGGEIVVMANLASVGSTSLEDFRAGISYLSVMNRIVDTPKETRGPRWLRRASAGEIRGALSKLIEALEVKKSLG